MALVLRLMFLCALLCIALAYTENGGIMDCCLSVSRKRIPGRIVANYLRQEPADGCRIRAVVFITVRSRRLCAPPYKYWVRELIHMIDQNAKASSW
ncbi:C-C motif chemokine 19 [Callorhinchus milii]|uniref:C-C motif chemokine n=1 Tax=Callorhinchus milii TaxID=7868 RepID=V9LIZ6_CALMI|nr:C-C motif chemokine 19 [Callorhinchus milii]|eukprot:gi/632986248/ref/XP_007910129.1/ PREDICTED: C-C motif chemokine 19-like [Callorhinchus milii]